MYACVHCMCTVCESDDCRSQKALGPLELELQVVVSHRVGAGNQPGVLLESNQ